MVTGAFAVLHIDTYVITPTKFGGERTAPPKVVLEGGVVGGRWQRKLAVNLVGPPN